MNKEINVLDDKVHTHVKVKGEGLYGAPGKYRLYIVFIGLLRRQYAQIEAKAVAITYSF